MPNYREKPGFAEVSVLLEKPAARPATDWGIPSVNQVLRTEGGAPRWRRPDSAPPSLPRMPSPTAAPAASAPAELLVLHTFLLGDLRVPGSSARAAIHATHARGEGTRRAYRSAWNAFEA